MPFNRRLRAALAALLLTFFGTVNAYGMFDRTICSAADAGPACSGTEVITSTNEEIGGLDNRAPMNLGSISGTNTILASVTPTLTAYADPQTFYLKPANDITGAATLNINTIGAKDLVNASGSALSSGDLLATNIYLVRYYASGDHFRVLTNLGSGGFASASGAYIMQANSGSFSAERALTAGNAIDLADGGANSTMTVDVDLTELNSIVFGSGTFTTMSHNAGAVDPVFTFGSGTFDVSAVTTMTLDDELELRFFEEDAGGSNYKGFKAPAAITANTTCTFENDANFIPDSCVGDGTDAGGTVTDADYDDITVSGTGTVFTIDANSVALTTDTTGNYMADIAAGAGIAVTHTPAEGSTGTIAFSYADQGASPALAADACQFTSNATTPGMIVCEGDTADTFESRVVITDPSADRAFTIPNADSAAVQPLTCGGTDKVSAISALGVLTCTADAGAGGGIGNVVEDLTPQLGGTLDTNGFAIEFGTAATDTSVVRSSAGNLTIEGNVVYRAGGTDVAVADGGTGASALTDLIALTTHTTGNYAAGDAEAGAALTGDSATAFFSAGTIELARGGTGASLADPNADRVMFWDDSAGATAYLTMGTAYTFDTTTLRSPTESFCVAASDESTAITTGTAKVTFRMPYAFTLTNIRGSLNTVSSSGSPLIDINEAETSVATTNKLLIDVSEKTSVSAATAITLTDTSLADDAEMTIDIDTAGTGAKGLKVCLIGYQT